MSIAAIIDRALAREPARYPSRADIATAPNPGDGALGMLRGQGNEERVWRALEMLPRPAWIISFRRATPQENAGGIDLVLRTSLGYLPLQIKSSPQSARRWRKRCERRGIVVETVVVRDNLSDTEILRRVIDAAETAGARAALTAARGMR